MIPRPAAPATTRRSASTAPIARPRSASAAVTTPPGVVGFSTQFDWPTQAGATYNVFVHGFSSQTGDFDLAILDDGVPAEGANDCDGVPEAFDFCPGTVIPESVPTSGTLSANNSALTDVAASSRPPRPTRRGCSSPSRTRPAARASRSSRRNTSARGTSGTGAHLAPCRIGWTLLEEHPAAIASRLIAEPGCERRGLRGGGLRRRSLLLQRLLGRHLRGRGDRHLRARHLHRVAFGPHLLGGRGRSTPLSPRSPSRRTPTTLPRSKTGDDTFLLSDCPLPSGGGQFFSCVSDSLHVRSIPPLLGRPLPPRRRVC